MKRTEEGAPASMSAGRATGVELRAHDHTPSLPSVTQCTSATALPESMPTTRTVASPSARPCGAEPCRCRFTAWLPHAELLHRVDAGHAINRHGALAIVRVRGADGKDALCDVDNTTEAAAARRERRCQVWRLHIEEAVLRPDARQLCAAQIPRWTSGPRCRCHWTLARSGQRQRGWCLPRGKRCTRPARRRAP